MRAKGIPHLIVTSVAALGLAACGPDVGEGVTGQKMGRMDSPSSTPPPAGDAKSGEMNPGDVKAGEAKAEDSALVAAVKSELAMDPDLRPLGIEVEVREGVVVLKGIAPNETLSDRAAQIAMKVAGVKVVSNQIAPRKG